MVISMSNPCLYIIINPLDSMNHGKALAHAAHAANAAEDLASMYSHDDGIQNAWKAWKNSTTQGFGTTITLQCKEWSDVKEFAMKIDNEFSFLNVPYFYDFVVDPTYPFIVNNEMKDLLEKEMDLTSDPIKTKDGWLLCRREETAFFLFIDKDEIDMLLLKKLFKKYDIKLA